MDYDLISVVRAHSGIVNAVCIEIETDRKGLIEKRFVFGRCFRWTRRFQRCRHSHGDDEIRTTEQKRGSSHDCSITILFFLEDVVSLSFLPAALG